MMCKPSKSKLRYRIDSQKAIKMKNIYAKYFTLARPSKVIRSYFSQKQVPYVCVKLFALIFHLI